MFNYVQHVRHFCLALFLHLSDIMIVVLFLSYIIYRYMYYMNR